VLGDIEVWLPMRRVLLGSEVNRTQLAHFLWGTPVGNDGRPLGNKVEKSAFTVCSPSGRNTVCGNRAAVVSGLAKANA